MALGLPAGLLNGLQSGTGGAAAGEQADDEAQDPSELRSTMAGSVAKWLAEPGTEVAAGTPVLVLEAMKMEMTVHAHRAGVLGEQLVATGETVSLNTALTTIG